MNDRGQGRKPLKEGVESVIVPIRMLPSQREKLQRIGGAAWVRKAIDRAKEPSASSRIAGQEKKEKSNGN
jgi:hypothetical protein